MYKNSGSNYIDIKDRDFQEFKMAGNLATNLEKYADSFEVRPIYKDVLAQIAKCDKPAILPDNPIFERTIEVLTSYFSFMESEPGHDNNEQTYDLGTSPGLPYNKNKMRTKRQVLEVMPEKLKEYITDLDYPDIDCANDKIELLTSEELKRHKVRNIFGSSFHGIYREKTIYGRQNNAFADKWKDGWIKYGFVKQYGGFNRLLKQLEKYDTLFESDCTGWDRSAPLSPVYRIRNALLIKLNDYWISLRDKVTKSNVNPTVLLPNGYVVQRQTGNDSGKNNTTLDNSILHKIIEVYKFFKRMDALGIPLELSYLFENAHVAIYGDDKFGGMNLFKFFDSVEHFKQFEIETYAEFGLEIKPGTQIVSFKGAGAMIPPEHSFLGSFAHFDNDKYVYVPHPRLNKVCSTMTQRYNGKDKIVRFCRMLNLALNCYPNKPVFEEALNFCKFLYGRDKDERWQFDEILRNVDISLSADDSFRRIYQGFESGKFTEVA